MLCIRLYCAFAKQNLKPSILSNIFCKITSLPPCTFPIVALGLFSGFPTGAVSACEMYSKGLCSKQEASRAAALSNNCSGAFLIGVAGAKICGSAFLGYILLFSQILSVITGALLLRFVSPLPKTPLQQRIRSYPTNSQQNKIKVFCGCVASTGNSIVSLCCYVMFFSLFSGIISDLSMRFFSHTRLSEISFITADALISGFFEISSGTSLCQSLSFPRNILVVSTICGFSGLSVLFQVTSICSEFGISTKEWLICHIFNTFLMPLYIAIILYFTPKIKSHINPVFLSLFVISLAMLYLLLKIIKKQLTKNAYFMRNTP